MKDPIRATYLIETPHPVEFAAEMIAGEQSSGTFLPVPGETEELKAEVAKGDVQKSHEELGDILFVLANLARKLDVEPENALRMTNAKFVRRFEIIEAELAKIGKTPDQSDLAEMDALWNAAKLAERENS